MKHNLLLQYLPIILSMIIPSVVISYQNFQHRSFTMLGKVLFILEDKGCKIKAFDLNLYALSDSFVFLLCLFITV